MTGEPVSAKQGERGDDAMSMTKAMVKDAMRALLVLALVFFNLAHAPASAAVGYDSELQPYLLPTGAAFVDCGDAQDDGPAHAPCHACRIGGAADLPPAPGSCLSAPLMAGVVAYSVRTDHRTHAILPHSGKPRAPPAV
jgi:hypothetical protein